MNPAAQKLMRRSLAESLGQPLEQYLFRWPNLAESFRDVLEAREQIILGEEAKSRYYELPISPLYNRQKELIGRLIVLHDITQYKRLEKKQERYAKKNAQLFHEEQRQRKIAEGLRRAMLVLSKSLDHVAIVAEILTQIKKLTPYDSAGFFLQDGELLQHLVKAFVNRTRIPVNLIIKGDCILPPDVQITFYRISQETLVNITKHTNATLVDLNFDCTLDQAALSICDNGRGFDVNYIPPVILALLSCVNERIKLTQS